MLFIFVKFQTVIREDGLLGYVVVIVCVIKHVIIAWYQSDFFGALEGASRDFLASAVKCVPKHTYLGKVVKSFQPFYLEEVYPFFHFHKDTFLEFGDTGVNYAITLLLW